MTPTARYIITSNDMCLRVACALAARGMVIPQETVMFLRLNNRPPRQTCRLVFKTAITEKESDDASRA